MSSIRPGILTVQEGQLNKTKIVDGVIEHLGFMMSEIAVILFMGKPYHVEVSTNQPRSVSGWGDTFEFIKESWPKVRNRRSVNIGYAEGEVESLVN